MAVNFIWKRKAGGGDDSGHVAAEHEYVVCFAKDATQCAIAPIQHESPSMTAKYNRMDGDQRYYLERLDKTSLTYNKSMDFAIECPDGTFISPPQPDPSNPTTSWRWGKQTVIDRRSELTFEKDKKAGEWRVYTRTYEPKDGVTPRSLLVEKEHGRNRDGTQELDELLGPKSFNNPKPTRFICHLLSMGAKESDALVLDFFGGSGTTAQAVLDLNKQDNGDRKFVLVQLPEPTERKDYRTIADIAKERVRRVIKKQNEADGGNLKLQNGKARDLGFRVFKLQSSNFKAWNADQPKDDAELAKQLTLHVDHLVAERTQEDVLYELLLKSGFTLNTKVEQIALAGKCVFSVADGAMMICLEKKLTPEVIKAMAEKKPERVVCLDAGFADNDQLKTNAVQTMKAKGVTKFQTV